MRIALLSILLAACTGRGPDVSEPWRDTWRWDSGIDTPDPDTDDPVESSQTITLSTSGTWTLTPAGGPYAAVAGTLAHAETVSGAEAPACTLELAVAGPAAESGCEGCDATFTVTHTLTSGDPASCRSPDLPADGAVWTAGYHPSGVVRVDRGSGTWISLYTASRTGDTVTFGVENTLLFQD